MQVSDKIWCDNRICNNDQCVRKIRYAPYGVVLTVTRFQVENNGKCHGFLEAWEQKKSAGKKKEANIKSRKPAKKPEKKTTKKPEPKKSAPENFVQLSLFDMDAVG